MPRPSPVQDFVDDLEARGRLTFQKADLTEVIETSEAGLTQALYRLSKKGRVVRLRGDFYLILPLEYRKSGALPPTWFIDDLMAYLDQPYYVGVLSAATLHGASHQHVAEFQVVTTKPVRAIEVGQVRLQFIVNSRLGETPTREIRVTTGDIHVSTPEATALDLLRYTSHAAGLDHVATVLAELGEAMDPAALAALARAQRKREKPNLQRLGYLLDLVGASELASAVYAVLFRKRARRERPGGKRHTLTGILPEVPEETFWRRSTHGRRVPDFNGIFVHYLRELHGGDLPTTEALLEDIASGQTVNLSTFQRAVASEARRRAPAVLLRPDLPAGEHPTDPRWMIVVNAAVEPDL